MTSRKLGFSKEDEVTIVFCGSKKTLASGVPMAQILFAGQAVGLLLDPARAALRQRIDDMPTLIRDFATMETHMRNYFELRAIERSRSTIAEARASARSQRNIALSLTALRDLALSLDPDSPRTQSAFCDFHGCLGQVGRSLQPLSPATRRTHFLLPLQKPRRCLRAAHPRPGGEGRPRRREGRGR